MEKTISINVQLTILKPVGAVFAAAANPIPFFVGKATEPLAEGKTVLWTFPEMTKPVPVKVRKVVPNQLIRFEWDSGMGGQNSCEFAFAKPVDHNPSAKSGGDATTISIIESGWPDDEKGRDASCRNTMGWTHMACSLKAYLEYGVNLRNGSFLHMNF